MEDLSHILNITTHALDGCFNTFTLGFRRRNFNDIYERVSGSRLHANYFRAGGVHQDLPRGLDEDISKFASRFPKIIED